MIHKGLNIAVSKNRTTQAINTLKIINFDSLLGGGFRQILLVIITH